MPIFQNNVYQYFQKEIEEAGNKKVEKLVSEIDSLKSQNLRNIQEEIADTITRTKENELNEMNLEYSAALNRIKVESHKKVIKKKRDLLESVLLEVKNKLLNFVKTENYKEKMKFLIKKIDKDFCGDQISFKLKKGDQILTSIIKENFKNKFRIIEDERIEIGGFIAVCDKKGILTDQTIDSNLEERKRWFLKTSKLAIKK